MAGGGRAGSGGPAEGRARPVAAGMAGEGRGVLVGGSPGRTHLLKSKGMLVAGTGQAAGPAAPGPGSRLAAAGCRARK